MKKVVLFFSLLSFVLFMVSCSNDSKAQKSAKPQATIENHTSSSLPVSDPTGDQSASVQGTTQTNPWASINPTKVNQITTEQFKQLIFDYTKSQVWQYKGDKPCVIDFYADWCRPCRYVSPIMEELAKEYKGKIYFYKINVDNEREVAQVFGIRSIPSVLFCPVKGQPRMAIGAMQKQNYIQAIKEILGVSLPSVAGN